MSTQAAWPAYLQLTRDDCVDWFNHRRLLKPIGYVPPAEAEARDYEQAAVPCLTLPALA